MVASLRDKVVMRYHNITPASFFEGVSPQIELECRFGRQQDIVGVSRCTEACQHVVFTAQAGGKLGEGVMRVDIVGKGGTKRDKTGKRDYGKSLL